MKILVENIEKPHFLMIYSSAYPVEKIRGLSRILCTGGLSSLYSHYRVRFLIGIYTQNNFGKWVGQFYDEFDEMAGSGTKQPILKQDKTTDFQNRTKQPIFKTGQNSRFSKQDKTTDFQNRTKNKILEKQQRSQS